MGVSIDVNVYKFSDLWNEAQKIGIEDKGLFIKILDACGLLIDDNYIIVYNEYYEGFNPEVEIDYLLASAFKNIKAINLFGNCEHTNKFASVDSEEVAEELGFELIDKDEYENQIEELWESEND